uniref:Uncharacterized protein n=1 Tax=Arundo donax TaxID=35708 RepID=A0A0A9CKP8_ARUDO
MRELMRYKNSSAVSQKRMCSFTAASSSPSCSATYSRSSESFVGHSSSREVDVTEQVIGEEECAVTDEAQGEDAAEKERVRRCSTRPVRVQRALRARLRSGLYKAQMSMRSNKKT